MLRVILPIILRRLCLFLGCCPRLLDLAGVVEVGLFVAICDAVVMAAKDGVVTLIKQGGRLA